MKHKVIEAYDKLSASYEHDVDTHNAYNIHYERPAMINMLPDILTGLRVLDAGCAAGWYTEYLLQNGAVPTAIDISPQMVEATKRRTKGKGQVICADLAEALPFDDDQFDIIVSSLVLHYLEDWDQTFSEFARVLKPSGMLLFSVHHPFMDISMSETNAYFETELLTDYWQRRGEQVEVVFYRRPLQSILNVTSAYFALEQVVEPLPTEQFKAMKPDSYEQLQQQPSFLIIEARCK